MTQPVPVDADPTMHLIDALNRANPLEWGRVIYGMPIFVEHDGYEVEKADGTKKLVIVPKGEQPPPNARRVYSIDADRLADITRQINHNYNQSGKPIKLFLGHSDPDIAQTKNPQIAGFGRGAYLGRFGPEKLLAIKTDAFYRLGGWVDDEGIEHRYADAASEFPERSPEFVPRTNAIASVALLKTEPRLPMGMVAYGETETERLTGTIAYSAHETIIYYGAGLVHDPYTFERFGDRPMRNSIDKHELAKEKHEFAKVQADLRQLRDRIGQLEEEEFIAYAERELATLEREGKVIKNRKAAIAHLAGAKSAADYRERLNSMRINYADDMRRNGLAFVGADLAKGPSALEIVRYGEENDIDVATDQGLAYCIEALTQQTS